LFWSDICANGVRNKINGLCLKVVGEAEFDVSNSQMSQVYPYGELFFYIEIIPAVNLDGFKC